MGEAVAANGSIAANDLLAPGYRVINLLSRGSDLDVYDVWSDERHCRCVAKVLRADRQRARAARQRLLQEGELLLTLTHPHIVRAYELVRQPQPALLLETLGGATLAQVINDQSPSVRIADLVLLGFQLGSALRYLHRHGFLHLDLKPSNIIITAQQAKLIDLSIAGRPGPGRRGVGTPSYMAPEQVAGGSLSEATDVWGLGIVLFELATGQHPLPPRRPADGQRPPSPSGTQASAEARAHPVQSLRRLPARLAHAIDACLAPSPATRPTLDSLTGLFRELAPAGLLDGPANAGSVRSSCA